MDRKSLEDGNFGSQFSINFSFLIERLFLCFFLLFSLLLHVFTLPPCILALSRVEPLLSLAAEFAIFFSTTVHSFAFCPCLTTPHIYLRFPPLLPLLFARFCVF